MSRQDSVIVTMKITTLTITRSTSGSISLSWSRHKKGGKTSTKKIGENDLSFDFDAVFPMECNFKRRKDKWADKIVTIELHYNGKRQHKWPVNLSELFSSDIIATTLKCENASLGSISVEIILSLGADTEKSPQKAGNPRKSGIPKPSSAAPVAIPRKPKIGNDGKRGLSPSKATHGQKYRSIAVNDYHVEEAMPSSDLTALINSHNSTNNVLPGIRTNHRRTASTHIQNSIAAQLFDEENLQMKAKIDEFTKRMREDGPKYQNGVPRYGIKIIDYFSEQPRGTSFINPLSNICVSLCAYAQTSLEACLYSFMSLTCIYAGLKNYGWDSMARNYDIKDKVDSLFKDLIGQLNNLYKNELAKNDDGINEKLLDLFEEILNGDEFGEFLVKLILLTLFSSLPPKIAKMRIKATGVEKMTFFDESLMDVEDEEDKLIDDQKAMNDALEHIEDVPYPDV
ncbi:hypothetical protein TRFO_19418 [Tritrichomonas foetus]|uniref:C2 NT-type domain-containing protein n=1 Tax=Tritrichomonas foetus TaxID=1144522 RepID=A0A1J4KNP2_9EUKA|nr:hypothetical protein TRFO_19418 [Tritrichomonas foetus]|eukprot:OHT11029.1 hypothetical protein TRFO_19418 [Tritrichomonas foetus]